MQKRHGALHCCTRKICRLQLHVRSLRNVHCRRHILPHLRTPLRELVIDVSVALASLTLHHLLSMQARAHKHIILCAAEQPLLEGKEILAGSPGLEIYRWGANVYRKARVLNSALLRVRDARALFFMLLLAT